MNKPSLNTLLQNFEAEQIQRSLGAVRLNTVPNSYREVNASINHGDPLTRTAKTESSLV